MVRKYFLGKVFSIALESNSPFSGFVINKVFFPATTSGGRKEQSSYLINSNSWSSFNRFPTTFREIPNTDAKEFL